MRAVLFYADQFVLPLPAGHRFPMAKYALLRERLEESGAFSAGDFRVPPAASDEEITRAHCRDYLNRVQGGTLSKDEIREIGFPWSPEMVERSRRSSGATLAAARVALERGWGANLAGGTHHAGHAKGEGFCVFNDAAITARALQAEGRAERIAVIDCDVHQGNGTAAIFADDDSVFTFSIHGARNYPFRREVASDLDIDLPDGTGDREYSQALEGALDYVLRCHAPDFAIYLAGADPFEDDRLGRLKLTKAGLAQRDELVLSRLKDAGIPVVIAMAGGYARDIRDTVDIHANTLLTARRLLG